MVGTYATAAERGRARTCVFVRARVVEAAAATMGILRLGPAQRFEVPVVEVLVAQRTLQLWIVLGHLGVAVMTLVDAIFFGNLLALQFTAAQVYGASFEFWLLYVHIVKLPLDVYLMYAFGRSRVSFGTVNLAIALVLVLLVAIADAVTLVVLIIELVTCTNEYCFREGTDGVGTIGAATVQFYILLFTVIGSLVLRIASSIGITFLKQSIRVRNTTALENIPMNRETRNPVSNVGVGTVTAIAAALPGATAAAGEQQWRYAARQPTGAAAGTTSGDLRFYADSGADDSTLLRRCDNDPVAAVATATPQPVAYNVNYMRAINALQDPRTQVEAIVHYTKDNGKVVVNTMRFSPDEDDDEYNSADESDDDDDDGASDYWLSGGGGGGGGGGRTSDASTKYA